MSKYGMIFLLLAGFSLAENDLEKNQGGPSQRRLRGPRSSSQLSRHNDRKGGYQYKNDQYWGRNYPSVGPSQQSTFWKYRKYYVPQNFAPSIIPYQPQPVFQPVVQQVVQPVVQQVIQQVVQPVVVQPSPPQTVNVNLSVNIDNPNDNSSPYYKDVIFYDQNGNLYYYDDQLGAFVPFILPGSVVDWSGYNPTQTFTTNAPNFPTLETTNYETSYTSGQSYVPQVPPTSYVSTGTIPDYSSYMPQPDITTSYSQYVPAQVAVPRFGISDYLVKNRWGYSKIRPQDKKYLHRQHYYPGQGKGDCRANNCKTYYTFYCSKCK